MRNGSWLRISVAAGLGLIAPFAAGQTAQPRAAGSLKAARPWMEATLSADQRAALVVRAMTLDEKIAMVHGSGNWGPGKPRPAGDLGGAGFVPGVPRLGIPGINMADSAVGVTRSAQNSHYATLLPSVLGAAASWDARALHLYGSVIGRELRESGYNMSIGGGLDLAREPRNGRNFEYAGEDPLLAGTMVGEIAEGVQASHVMGDIKHFALNDQETGRTIVNAELSERAARESDLLAFQIAIGMAHPAGVMCSYNRETITPAQSAAEWSCQNGYLLNQVLKNDWGFKGFVLSDWGGTHSTVHAFMSGLDQEQPGQRYFGKKLKQAIAAGRVPMARLNDAVERILRGMFANGVIDAPPQPEEVDPFRGRDDAERIAAESLVLLKNAGGVLPLAPGAVKSIAIIGSHADVAVLSGGGSAQVDAPGGGAVNPHAGATRWRKPVWFPSSPEKAIRRHAPAAAIRFNSGGDVEAAARLAGQSQIAIVFVNQWMSEGGDSATLALPDNQDALVRAVARANPRTIVVAETGGPVAMPWVGDAAAIIEAWYPGIGGAQALGNILFGAVDPSGRLPITFPRESAQLPHPRVPGMDLLGRGRRLPPFNADYNLAGVRVGYKWFEARHETPLFPFGFGLSYTSFTFSGLSVNAGSRTARLTVSNPGPRAGTAVAQLYAVLPPASGESDFKRLVGWARVDLAPGESKTVSVAMNRLALSIFDVSKNAFVMAPGEYRILAGSSSADTPLSAAMQIGAPPQANH